jgi:hypothetical protein
MSCAYLKVLDFNPIFFVDSFEELIFGPDDVLPNIYIPFACLGRVFNRMMNSSIAQDKWDNSRG